MSKNISDDKNLYRELCAKGLDVPVFFQDWWLDAVCENGDWQVVLYVEDPNVVAIMTYCKKKKFFFESITVPPLTKFMGPYFIRQFEDRKMQSILDKLLDEFPVLPLITQTLHYQINNWLPYKWRGYIQTVYYSYVLKEIQQIEEIWGNIDSDYRNNKIESASQHYEVREDLDFDKLFELTLKPFKRQNISMPISKCLLENVVIACEKNNSGRSLYAMDRAGEIAAAIYLVWDKNTCYLLLAGENEKSRRDGAGIYLTWKGIEYASRFLHLNTFDFLGGMSKNLERTRRQFGAQQQPYFLISKATGIFKWIKAIR